MSSYVYAIAAESGLVKIGFTTNPRFRLSHLRANNVHALTPIGAIKATREQEAALHDILAEDRVRGEWFKRGEITERFLARLPAWDFKERKLKQSDDDNPIRKARLSMKMTQTEMAAALGVNLSTVWRWEKGQLPISDRTTRAVELLLSQQEKAA